MRFQLSQSCRALLLVICLLAVGPAFAVGFGELKVHSYLNQPFDATVELLNTDGVRNLQVDLAVVGSYTH
ncbi:MAG: hypothetical protein AAGA23_15000 [Pseudomonadota bacterium]